MHRGSIQKHAGGAGGVLLVHEKEATLDCGDGFFINCSMDPPNERFSLLKTSHN